jgi:hypothetical protein
MQNGKLKRNNFLFYGLHYRPLSRADLSIRSSKEGRIFVGAAIGCPLPQQQIVQADEQCSPLQEKSFSLDGWCAIMPSRGERYGEGIRV